MKRTVSTLMFLMLCVTTAPAAPAVGTGEVADLSPTLRAALEAPLSELTGELRKEENADGVKNKRGTFSKRFHKVDENTYQVVVHRDTAGKDTLTTERLLVTLKPEDGKTDKWVVAEQEVQDTQQLLHRSWGARFYPFEKLSFDREGLKLSAANGGLFEWYYRGEVSGFLAVGDDMRYSYTPPDYLGFYDRVQFNHRDGYIKQDYSRQLDFAPTYFRFFCDAQTCEELLSSIFTGLDREPAPGPDAAGELGRTEPPSWVSPEMRTISERLRDKYEKKIKEDPFAHFQPPDQVGNRWYGAEVHKTDDHYVGITYDNWEGYEVKFWIMEDYEHVPDPTFFGWYTPIHAYYTEETLKNSNPYELERRDDKESRWYELEKVDGEIELALDDPENMKGDVKYVMNIKQDLQEMPFFIATIRKGKGEERKNPTLSVNSIEFEGEELTWVKTGPYSGLVHFPRPLSAGDQIEMSMAFEARVIYKRHHAYSEMFRGGWLPFSRFHDQIDDFRLIVKSPAQYKLLGIGKKVSERREDAVLVTEWKASGPVSFPTLIFGKYIEATPGKELVARKLDGTEIPIVVHVDEVSAMQLTDADVIDGEEDINIKNIQDTNNMFEELSSGARGIRQTQLTGPAKQAAFAINLYEQLTGLDYPYDKLDMVNDPAPAMYGQAPSSTIYLGSWVFRGEGALSGAGGWLGEIFGGFGGGGTRTAKFLKSVVAHEVAHQWWGSRITNANDRNYWFVESLAEFFSALYLERAYGWNEYLEQVDEWRAAILTFEEQASVQDSQTTWQGPTAGAARYGALYAKGPYAFHVLRMTFRTYNPDGTPNDDKFFKFLKDFSQELDTKGEIVTRDIQMAAEKALGGFDAEGNPYTVDLGWFFDQWIRGTGIPQYRLMYTQRQAEDGSWIIEGSIEQRVVVGSRAKHDVLKDIYYRGVVPITVTTKSKQEYNATRVVEGAETKFQLRVPDKPIEVVLNKYNHILAHDVIVNGSWN